VIDSGFAVPFALKVFTRTIAAAVELAVAKADTATSAVANAEVEAMKAVDDPGAIVITSEAVAAIVIVKSVVTVVTTAPAVYEVAIAV